MSQHQTRLSRRRPAVFPFGDLDVRSTDSGGNGFHEDRALAQIGLRKIFVPDCPGLFRFYRNRFHGVTSFLGSTVIASMLRSTARVDLIERSDEVLASSLPPWLRGLARRFSFALLEHLLRIKRRKQMHDTRDRPGPSRLVARADPRAGVPVEVLIE